MYINKITRKIPPPSADLARFRGDATSATRIMSECGSSFPLVLIEFGSIYGSGYFSGGNRLEVLNPFDDSTFHAMMEYNEIYRSLRSEYPDTFPLPPFSSEGGLLPFAFGDPEMVYFMLTAEGVCNPEVFYDDRSSSPAATGLCLDDFLDKFISGDMEPKSFFYEPVTFVPFSLSDC